MGGDINRTFTDWNLLQVHMVKEPMPGMGIPIGSISSDLDGNISIWNGSTWVIPAEYIVYKYDEAMKILEKSHE